MSLKPTDDDLPYRRGLLRVSVDLIIRMLSTRSIHSFQVQEGLPDDCRLVNVWDEGEGIVSLLLESKEFPPPGEDGGYPDVLILFTNKPDRTCGSACTPT